MSSLLFYGPGAEQHSLNESHKIGRLLQTFGSEGLKTEEAREAVMLLNMTPVGDHKGVVLIGPMDLAQPKASDVLLKSLEDFNEKVVQPILWANDIGNVIPTIRSRCLSYWCYGEPETPMPLQEATIALLEAFDKKDVLAIVEVLKEHKKALRELLNVVVLFISQNILSHPHLSRIWFPLRRILGQPEPSYLETLVALLPAKVTL